MTGALAGAGWLVAAAALALAALVVRERARRVELVARACHELRGPLHAARLGLHLLARRRAEPGRPGRRDRHRAAAGGSGAGGPSRGPGRSPRARPARDGGRAVAAAHGGRGVAPGRRRRAGGAPPGRAGERRPGPRRPAAPRAGVREPPRQRDRARRPADRAARRERTPRRVRIEVRDDGPGPARPGRALAAGPGRAAERAGRGLAIAADIASRHGGRLSAAPGARRRLPRARAAGVRRAVAVRAIPPPPDVTRRRARPCCSGWRWCSAGSPPPTCRAARRSWSAVWAPRSRRSSRAGTSRRAPAWAPGQLAVRRVPARFAPAGALPRGVGAGRAAHGGGDRGRAVRPGRRASARARVAGPAARRARGRRRRGRARPTRSSRAAASTWS